MSARPREGRRIPLSDRMGPVFEQTPAPEGILSLTCAGEVVVLIQSQNWGNPIADPAEMTILRVEPDGGYRTIACEAVGTDGRPRPELSRRQGGRVTFDPGPGTRFRGAIQCPRCRDYVPFRAERLAEVVNRLTGAGVDTLPLDRLPSLLHQVSGG